MDEEVCDCELLYEDVDDPIIDICINNEYELFCEIIEGNQYSDEKLNELYILAASHECAEILQHLSMHALITEWNKAIISSIDNESFNSLPVIIRDVNANIDFDQLLMYATSIPKQIIESVSDCLPPYVRYKLFMSHHCTTDPNSQSNDGQVIQQIIIDDSPDLWIRAVQMCDLQVIDQIGLSKHKYLALSEAIKYNHSTIVERLLYEKEFALDSNLLNACKSVKIREMLLEDTRISLDDLDELSRKKAIKLRTATLANIIFSQFD